MVGSVSGSSGSNAGNTANVADHAPNDTQNQCMNPAEGRPCTAAERDSIDGLGDAIGGYSDAVEAAERAKAEPDACAAEAAVQQAQRAAAAAQAGADKAAAAEAREPSVENKSAADLAARAARDAGAVAAEAAAAVKAGNIQRGTIGCVSQGPANPTPTLSASMLGELRGVSVDPYGAGVRSSG